MRILFQSTLSVRRATPYPNNFRISNINFNPRSPWGERPNTDDQPAKEVTISIHALREESD